MREAGSRNRAHDFAVLLPGKQLAAIILPQHGALARQVGEIGSAFPCPIFGVHFRRWLHTPPPGEFEQVVLYRYGPAQVGLNQSFTSCWRLAAPFETESTMPAAHTRGEASLVVLSGSSFDPFIDFHGFRSTSVATITTDSPFR